MKTFNFYNAAFFASSLLAILVITAELISPFKTFLATIFSHHWIGKAVIITITFLILGFVYKKDSLFGVKSEVISWYTIIISFIVIFIFYLVQYLI